MLAAAVAVLASGVPAWAQVPDGKYTGTIRCSELPTTDVKGFSQQMGFAVAKGAITGERNVGTATQVGASGVVEKWSGTVAPDGAISATSTSSSSRAPIQGNFTGRGTEDGFNLKGTQAFVSRTGARSERSCTVVAKR